MFTETPHVHMAHMATASGGAPVDVLDGHAREDRKPSPDVIAVRVEAQRLLGQIQQVREGVCICATQLNHSAPNPPSVNLFHSGANESANHACLHMGLQEE